MSFQELFCVCGELEKKKADKEYVAMEVDVVSKGILLIRRKSSWNAWICTITTNIWEHSNLALYSDLEWIYNILLVTVINLRRKHDHENADELSENIIWHLKNVDWKMYWKWKTVFGILFLHPVCTSSLNESAFGVKEKKKEREKKIKSCTIKGLD